MSPLLEGLYNRTLHLYLVLLCTPALHMHTDLTTICKAVPLSKMQIKRSFSVFLSHCYALIFSDAVDGHLMQKPSSRLNAATMQNTEHRFTL